MTKNIEFFCKNNITIIDSPGILDTQDKTLFHKAFIESIESDIPDQNLSLKLPIDIMFLVTKFDQTNTPNFLDVAQNFVRLFTRSATFSLMILFIERDKAGILDDNVFRQAVENSDGYQYLMNVKRGDENTTMKIPYCRWDNLAKTPEDMQRQIRALEAKIKLVTRPFSIDDMEFAIQSIRNEHDHLENI